MHPSPAGVQIPTPGCNLERSLIIIEISTDMLCIIPIIPIGFLPLKSVSGRSQRTGRRRCAPHSSHIVFRGIIETYIRSARTYTGTATGNTNGLWAVALIVPATGYLLSLANWFFVRVYISRKMFSYGSCIATLTIILLGYVWAAIHYAGGISISSPLVWCGAVCCVLRFVKSFV